MSELEHKLSELSHDEQQLRIERVETVTDQFTDILELKVNIHTSAHLENTS